MTVRSFSLIACCFLLSVSGEAIACRATLSSTGAVYTSVQSAFNASASVDTINVNGSTGTCNENVFLNNSRLRIILTGTNNASITGSGSQYTIDARTKGVGIFNINVFGGGGIAVQRNANAIIDRVLVQSSSSIGITIKELAFAVITNSTIQNSADSGIFVQSQASANIGLNNDTDTLFQGNIIQNNGGSGIFIAGNSIAKITGNSINTNSKNGVTVFASSSIFMVGNTVNNNVQSGLQVGGSSSAVLSPTGTLPNVTTSLNGQFGINCGAGAYIEGHYGLSNPLSGLIASGGKQDGTVGFDSTCISTYLIP